VTRLDRPGLPPGGVRNTGAVADAEYEEHVMPIAKGTVRKAKKAMGLYVTN